MRPTSLLSRLRVSRIDLLLVLLVLIWGGNYSLVKHAFRDIPPMPFNVVRFTLASTAFLIGVALVRRRVRRTGVVDPMWYTATPTTSRDWRAFALLGLLGHCGYHLFWATGLSMTTASNSALIMGVSPVVVSTTAALLGHERIRPLHWVGIVVSLVGIVVVVGRGASIAGPTLAGDLLTVAAMGCWTYLTLGGGRLMPRHSPLYVSAVTTTIGTIAYVLIATPTLNAVAWRALDWRVWAAMAFSGLLSIAAASLIWFAAVQRIGAARTSAYSNLVPLTAVCFAAVTVNEPLTPAKVIGAVLVLAGVVLTRMARDVATSKPEN